MKVFSKIISGNSFCYSKICGNLEKFSPPDIEFVQKAEDADLALLHINGRFDHFTKFVKDFGKPYVQIQYCLRSTKYKRPSKWRKLWENAAMVWSYYPLNDYIQEEGGNWDIPNFYHSPLGADPSLFTMGRENDKKYIILSSGWDAGQSNIECANEIYQAAQNAGKEVFHLGRVDNAPSNVVVQRGITDEVLASRYRQCSSVAGLRRIEGFEMPLVEGLFCGVRPIAFDSPCYRIWHNKWAEFVPEGSSEEIVEHLTRIFKKGIDPITEAEREEAVRMFNWQTIISGFWERLKNGS